VSQVPSIRRVVVPLDGSRASETALRPGAALANRLGADLQLLTARSRADSALAARYLERVEVPVTTANVEREVATGHTARQAIVSRLRHPSQLVCMATHGHTGLGEAVLGSTAEAVLRASTHPFILVGPRCRPQLRTEMNVLACIDGLEPASSLLGLARLARSLEAGVRVVTVTILADGLERDRLVRPELVDHLERLTEELAAQHVKADYEILAGHDIWPAINEAAELLPASLLAVTSHARSGLGRVLLGSEAMTIVRHGPIPVIVAHTP
jgi:nucleotide-binding universal stress UspA family protein